ncbi:hypothetical protein PG989_004391 [Apiospora arundinis]
MTGKRRSARQNPATPDSRDPAVVAEPNGRKDQSAGRRSPGRTALKTATLRGGKKNPAKPKTKSGQPASPVNRVSSLPPEILAMILNNVDHKPTMSALGRTSKAFYSIMMPRLYGRVVLHAQYHAHIPKLIRTLEPLLTIAQKKQLMNEGKYKGQKESYPTGLDENTKPSYAGHVRQLVIGSTDPGRKHKFIVDRYIEEAFKTLENIEIIDTWAMNASMAQSIASLEHLQALSIWKLRLVKDVETAEALSRVKNLRHLSLNTSYWDGDVPTDIVAQSLIRNSALTLRSLFVYTGFTGIRFFSENKTAPTGTPVQFPKLRSLRLLGLNLEDENVEGMLESVDFVKLDDLTLGSFHGEPEPVLDHLTALFSTASWPNLRALSILLSEDVEARTRFISSFKTLRKLVIEEYGQYSEDILTNPGIRDTLLNAILGHRHLRTLELTYTHGIQTGFRLPYPSAQTIGSIVDGLSELQDFVFAPEEEHIDKIGQILVRAKNLRSVTSPVRSSKSDKPGFEIVEGIVRAFLDNADISQLGKDFVWEEHFRLTRISASYRTWEIASTFGKGQKGMLKPEKLTGKIQDHEVWVRDVTDFVTLRMDVGYDPTFAWVDEVAGDLA